jgi:catabolite regulation protein CreA
MKKITALLLFIFAGLNATAYGEEIGEVTTVFKLLSPNSKIVISF